MATSPLGPRMPLEFYSPVLYGKGFCYAPRVYIRLIELKDYAALGCAVCRLQLEAVTRFMPELPGCEENPMIKHNHEFPMTLIIPGILRRINIAFEEWTEGNMRIGDPLSEPLESSDLQFAVRWTEKQVSKCVKSHTSCGSDAERPFPSRLLDVGTVSDPRIRLTEPQGNGRWICLSHRWSSQKQGITAVCTTTANLEDFKSEIPWHILPSTFQDAIDFVRQLDMQWLWIDSLCIVQDDLDDWKEQAAQMASIYQGAYLTLAATASSSSSGGLYTSLPRAHPAPKVLWISENFTGIGRAVARIDWPHINTTEESEFPLLQRAWVLQERLLSPRVIHFTGKELAFECRASYLCQCLDNDSQYDSKHLKAKFWKSSQYTTSEPNESWTVHKENITLWRNIVHIYSVLHVTKSSDILPAIAGLARVFNEDIGDRYLAGLWLKSLIQDLTWYTNSNNSSHGLAPSWSWASRGLGVNIDWQFGIKTDTVLLPPADPIYYDVKPWAAVLEASCVLIGPDLYGPVSSGQLILFTKSVPGKLFWWTGAYSTEDNPVRLIMLETAWFEFYNDYNFWEQGPHHMTSGSNVQIVAISELEDDRPVDSELACLVLRLLQLDPPIWERCGFLTIKDGYLSTVSSNVPQLDVHPEDWEEDESNPFNVVKLLEKTQSLFECAETKIFTIV